MKRILVIQDLSCVGKCSVTVALPILSAMGISCSVLPTAVLSTHTGFPNPHIRPLTENIVPIAEHLQQVGAEFDAILVGYLANPEQAEAVLEVRDILLPGVHNIENYMAAIAAVEGLVSDDAVRSVAKNFGGVEHRIELVRIKDGVRYYNDSIASSPSRTIAGLRSFSEKVLLIAGGYDKHIPYDVLGPEICKHVKKLYLGGATGPQIRAAVENCPEYTSGCPEIEDCGNFDAAFYAAVRDAKKGDIVLMSPASAAFDQFKNFMVRGDHFKKLVKEL